MSNYFFPLFVLLSYSFPFARMRIHAFFPLFPESLFFALPSICFLSSLSFFYLEMEPDERTPLCKAIFNPFWRPFSSSFFESFVSHPALLTPVVSISILLLHPFPTLSHSLSLPLLTVSSNPVSSKLCRILVRR